MSSLERGENHMAKPYAGGKFERTFLTGVAVINKSRYFLCVLHLIGFSFYLKEVVWG